ncbi:MAG TPA: WhiB family transcriptional regulator [Nocardioidaceae bacterium]
MSTFVLAEHGLCTQTDPEIFFPDRGDNSHDARQVCGICPVRALCLEWALALPEQYGIWGGTTESERRRIRRARATEKPAEPAPVVKPVPKPAREPVTCGTRRGYQRHRRLGEPACDPCRWANAAADRRLRETGSTLPAA